MLDAILIPQERVRSYQPREVWITWCDQIAVRPSTVRRLAETAQSERDAALVMPTIIRTEPYIHLVRNDSGEVVYIMHRREGERLPERGESDLGLFCLSLEAYVELLAQCDVQAANGYS